MTTFGCELLLRLHCVTTKKIFLPVSNSLPCKKKHSRICGNLWIVFTVHVISSLSLLLSFSLTQLLTFLPLFSFSRLFSSSSNTTKKPEPPVNLKYNAPTSHVTPSVKKRSSTLSQLPGDKSKAFDFLSEE